MIYSASVARPLSHVNFPAALQLDSCDSIFGIAAIRSLVTKVNATSKEAILQNAKKDTLFPKMP
jgi:hypothetical protein